MPCLLVFTLWAVVSKYVIRVIFVKVKPPIKPLARLGPTPPVQDPLFASNVHPEHMPILLVPTNAMAAVLIPTNPNPMLRNVFQCKKGSTNPVPQHK